MDEHDDEKPLGELHWDTWDLEPRAEERAALLEWVEEALATAHNRLVALEQHHAADVGEIRRKLELRNRRPQ